MIRNPVLPGFNADPSFLRVGADYYLATSTFAWHPGVAIHHSRDLAHWRLLTHALTRPSQLDLRGDGSSCGVWAPCLRFDHQAGLFTLLYTDVKNIASRFFDLHNWLITAPAIEGPWSDPVALNASGFDPSLFIDDDGRAYVANLEWDFRKGYTHPGAIVLQKYSRRERSLVGQPRSIYRGGSSLGCLRVRTCTTSGAGTTSSPPKAAPGTGTPLRWPDPARFGVPTSPIPPTRFSLPWQSRSKAGVTTTF